MSPRRLTLITGASAGIGAAFARAYAQRGWDVALTARRAERLEALAAELKKSWRIEAHVIAADLADPAAPAAILQELQQLAGRGPDGLVNNAGYGLPGSYANTSWADQAAFLQVMATAPAELTHKVLPGMLERRFGRIIQVASLAGIVPGAAGHTLYAAVKAFLIKFTQSLKLECEGTGVHVSALCPGFTYSEFHDVNGTRESVAQMPAWMWSSAEAVVEAGIAAVERNQAVCVPGGASKLLATLGRVLPDPLAEAMVKSNMNKFRRVE